MLAKESAFESSSVVLSPTITLGPNMISSVYFDSLELPHVPSALSFIRASLRLVSANNITQPTAAISVSAHASPNSPIFVQISGNLRDRVKTLSVATFQPMTWEASVAQLLDITPVVLEVIRQPGWYFGNPIALLVESDASYAAIDASLALEYSLRTSRESLGII